MRHPNSYRERILDDIRAGYGIDDIHHRRGLDYLTIWAALRNIQHRHLVPWVRLSMKRAVRERSGRRAAS